MVREASEEEVRWRVADGSSEADAHPATNVLRPERFRAWQTGEVCEEAWLVVEASPACAFSAVEIVNAGSALVEIHGLRCDRAEGEAQYELLLSPQQVMTVKDLMSKANRNRALVYDIDVNHKLSPVAAQQRWRKLRVVCRQPFGTAEHRACIGLSYIHFTACKPRSSQSKNGIIDSAGETSNAVAKRKSSCDSTDMHQKKLKPEPQNYAPQLESSQVSGMDGNMKKVVKPKLVIGLVTAAADDAPPLHRRDSKTNSRNLSSETVGNRKLPKVERGIEEQEIVDSKATKSSDDARPREATEASLKNSKPENVDIGFNAAQAVGKMSENAKRRSVAPLHTKLGKEVPSGASSKKTSDFSKILEGVVFAISGIQNPERALCRTQGLEMGAQYRPDWTSDCTVLLCAFMNTPKFIQVKADGGTIVFKEWISECHTQRKLVSIERFLMNKGRPWRVPVYKANCGSLEEVREWVYDDLASTSSWLLQQDPKPERDELELTAARGIMLCLEDTIKCIQNSQGVKSMVESWECLPQAIKELAAMEEGREGYMKGTRSTMLAEADRMKDVYSDILKPIFVACSKNPMKKEKRRSH